MIENGVRITEAALHQIVASCGCSAAAITADTGAAAAVGYTLHGPRGARKVIERGADDLFDLDSVRLWLDGISYANRKVADRRARRGRNV